MQRYELEAWLGPALDQMSSREVDTFAAMVERIETLYPADSDDRQGLGAVFGTYLPAGKEVPR